MAWPERYGDLSGDHGLLPDHKSAIGSAGIGLALGVRLHAAASRR
jgi:hypothetical protein